MVYMNTWPAIATFITAIVCTLRNVPYIYNVQDLYPESASALGHISKAGLTYRLLKRMDRFTALHSSQIIANSEEFAEVIHRTRNVPRGKVSVVWNWYDASVLPGPKCDDFRKSIAPAPNTHVIMYSGNIGSVAGLEVAIAAAEKLAKRGCYLFVLAGDGTSREQLQDECEAQYLQYPILLSTKPRGPGARTSCG